MSKLVSVVIATLFIALSSMLSAQNAVDREGPQPLSEDERIVHLLSRTTFGVTPSLVDQVKRIGRKAWLKEQLASSKPDEKTLVALGAHEIHRLDRAGIFRRFYGEDAEERSAENEIDRQFLGSHILRVTTNRQQLAEVSADFWRNHLNIDRDKESVFWTAIDFDRAVLRAHVFGSFEAMLEASAKHPSMLIYLDNHVSRRPPNKTELKAIARRVRQETGSKSRGEEAAAIAAQRGLNENYARELLELHTLGVDRGYGQDDVIAVAEAFTGWTIDREEGRYDFVFNPDMHVGGDKYFMSKTIRREKRRHGVREGEEVLRRLVRHPNTARFLAEKLVRQFVSDQPPESLVKSSARVLREHSDQLPRVLEHILSSEEFYDRRHYRTKFKTPQEFVFSALRVTRAKISDPLALGKILEDMGQGIYLCEDPTGYRDTAESWRDPGVMTARWRFALDLVRNRIRGVEVPETLIIDLKGRSTTRKIAFLGREVLPQGMREETLRYCIDAARRYERARRKAAEADEAAPTKPKGKKKPMNREDAFGGIDRFLLGVLLGSPEFQEQ